MRALFLSASVPKPGREYYGEADPLLIQAAVRALALVALGRMRIVWGGHPSITPMLWAACEYLGVQYATCVELYQSSWFDEDFPDENKRFGNLHLVPKIEGDLDASLLKMRTEMLSRPDLDQAVFIGGMNGVEQEYELFKRLRPRANVLFIASPGGASSAILRRQLNLSPQYLTSTDYTGMFFRCLRIKPSDQRFQDKGKKTP
ncbi:MAG: hypothetical protein JWR21_4360 [Herminiimonas sp.]|nr:hypothetical protein [Herminiimonas sp.]